MAVDVMGRIQDQQNATFDQMQGQGLSHLSRMVGEMARRNQTMDANNAIRTAMKPRPNAISYLQADPPPVFQGEDNNEYWANNDKMLALQNPQMARMRTGTVGHADTIGPSRGGFSGLYGQSMFANAPSQDYALRDMQNEQLRRARMENEMYARGMTDARWREELKTKSQEKALASQMSPDEELDYKVKAFERMSGAKDRQFFTPEATQIRDYDERQESEKMANMAAISAAKNASAEDIQQQKALAAIQVAVANGDAKTAIALIQQYGAIAKTPQFMPGTESIQPGALSELLKMGSGQNPYKYRGASATWEQGKPPTNAPNSFGVR